jgi:hypothetical protein
VGLKSGLGRSCEKESLYTEGRVHWFRKLNVLRNKLVVFCHYYEGEKISFFEKGCIA